MRHNEDFGRSYREQGRRSGDRYNQSSNLSNYQSRYENRGNYYGMPDQHHEYRNVSSQGSTSYGSSGPVGGYGASSWRSNRDQDDRHTQGQMHQNEWGGSGSNQYSNRDRDNYNYGSGSGSSQGDHYRYGDPNPYMNYERQGGYEKTRGTGWRRESDVDHANRRYDRQENSYRHTGHGRRFDQYGQDERYNYAHGRQDGRRSIEDSESLDDRYYDRGEHSRSSSDNDYGRQYGSNYDHRNQDREGRNDNYETRRFRDRDYDDSPSRSPRGYGYRSGPDYSADSPISSYGRSVRGYQK
ncbi:hypothetical protein [Pontibacter lucknowensis]|uniref:Uncharacterized protein n=1 Tax=Pontibacter lucknowensis TaxID=1077936 RepID=A0A1N6YIL5_9BACT|nr:hypothetical protein [Pontibacter lucknowensis]SIR14427.1 hypothetical protein SAMN05421545_2510 [Pontibacter lucknowensis]